MTTQHPNHPGLRICRRAKAPAPAELLKSPYQTALCMGSDPRTIAVSNTVYYDWCYDISRPSSTLRVVYKDCLCSRQSSFQTSSSIHTHFIQTQILPTKHLFDPFKNYTIIMAFHETASEMFLECVEGRTLLYADCEHPDGFVNRCSLDLDEILYIEDGQYFYYCSSPHAPVY